MEATISQISSQTALFLSSIMPIVAVIAISVNIFHVAILSKSTVTSSSMNTLLIGIAVVDILSPILYVEMGIVKVIDFWSANCTNRSQTEVLVELILTGLSENFRRCSTWLGLLLAVTRTVSLKLAARRSCDFITEPRFGVQLIVGTVLCSSLILSTFFLRYRVVEADPFYCNSPPGTVRNFTTNEFISLFSRRLHILLTGVGQLIPSVLFPFFAGILVCELRKPDKKASLASSKNAEKISKTVIYMTVTFLIIELPIGIGKMVNSMQTASTLPHDMNQIFHYLYVPMTILHCFICFSMSSQYQSTVLRMLGRKQRGSTLANQSTLVFSAYK